MAWRKFLATTLMLLMITTLGTGAAFAAPSTPSVQVAQDAQLGTILTGPNGMTLYRYTKDTPGISNCYEQCAMKWPPLLLQNGESPVAPAGLKGTLGTTTRSDGSVQLTYNGWPLYYWIKDKAPGDTTGQNVGKVWFVLNPDTPTVQLVQDAHLGTILTDANGMTLYVFTKDAPGVSNCYGQCAVKWPPLLLKDGELLNAPPGLAGKLGTTARTDGSLQVTLNGAPLYYWFKDKAPGDTTGHKVGGVWFVVEPGLLLDTAGTWAQTQISTAVRSGWVKGNPDGNFHPYSQVTRAEFVTMLTAAFKTPAATTPAGFSDTGTHWAAAAIQAADAAGIVQVTDYPTGQFEPDRAITRAEAIGMLVRALGLNGQAVKDPTVVSRFSDASQLSERDATLVGLAIQAGFVTGYPDNTIHGEKTASRAEAVSLILRALPVQK